MFGWRKRQIADRVDRDINNAAPLPVDATQAVSTPVVENEDALYTVGLNQAGNTQLVLKINYGTTTLTMDPGSVRRLIRQLEATLEKEEQR
jgi:hypothetical protein